MRADQLNSHLDIYTSIAGIKDMNHIMELNQGFPTEFSESGPGEGPTRSQRTTVIVDNRKHVNETCWRSLDKFQFRPQVVNEKPAVGVRGKNGAVIYPLSGDNIRAAGVSGTESGVQTQCFGIGVADRESLLESSAYTGYLPDEKENILVEGNPNSSEYRSNVSRYRSFPVLSISQELSQNMEFGIQQRSMISETRISPEDSPHPTKNHELVESDDYGNIDDDEMLMAIQGLEDNDTWGKEIAIPFVCDLQSDSVDKLPSVGDVGRYRSNANKQGGNLREQLSHIYSPPITPHKFLFRKQLAQPVQIYQQVLASIPDIEVQTLDPRPFSEIFTGSRCGDGLLTTVENFSPPSSVEFTLDDCSQEQEVFDCNLQGSPLQETEMKRNPVKIMVAITESYVRTGLDQREFLYGTQEWTPNPKETPCSSEEGAGEEEGMEENLTAESKGGRSKARVKKRAAGAEWDKRSSKKRKIRICDPSQLKISNYNTRCQSTSAPLSAVPSNKIYNRDGKMKPFVRPQFLPVVIGRPSVAGLSARLSMKTCFRVGEALKVGWMFTSGRFTGDALVELYGTHISSCEEVDW